MTDQTERELDARGLSCPMPLLKARALLASMRAGQRLRVRATDPDAVGDFTAYCEQSGHRLVEARQEADETVIVLEKG